MRSRLSVIVVIICIIILATFYLRPYNNVEFNAATLYYQSYSQLYRNISQYVGMLENYNNTEEEVYLESALIKLDNIIDNLTIFKLANQIDFRDTFINEKVVKTDIFSIENFEKIESNYHYSQDILRHYLEDNDNELKNSTFQDFVHYNQLILSGLTTKDVGYNPEKKEFRVALDDSKKPMFEEGIIGLREIMVEVITPN